jgi:cbb3-type cytochrome oxidase maturation protein
MNMLVYLMPVALLLGATGLVAFIWAFSSGQYDDLDGAAERVLLDPEPRQVDDRR